MKLIQILLISVAAMSPSNADCGWKDGYGCDGDLIFQNYTVDKFECYEKCELTVGCSCVTWQTSAFPVCSLQTGSPAKWRPQTVQSALSDVEAYSYSDTCRDEEDATTKCPGSFIFCAVQGGDCLIPDNIETGYISYGVDGRWVFFGFSNQWGTHDEAGSQCGAAWWAGQSDDSYTKHCCYIEADHIYPSLDDDEWTNCGNDGNACTGLDTLSTQWVRYGTNGDYDYQLVLSTDGEIPCDADWFHDPLPDDDSNMFCERMNAEYSFSGEWALLTGVTGSSSDSMTYSLSYGVVYEESTTTEVTSAWETGVKAGMSAGMVVTASIELSAGLSGSIVTSMGSVFSETLTEGYEITCAEDKLYQWVVSGEQSRGPDPSSFSVKSKLYHCNDNEPQCAYGCCFDEDCQSCTYDDETVVKSVMTTTPSPTPSVFLCESHNSFGFTFTTTGCMDFEDFDHSDWFCPDLWKIPCDYDDEEDIILVECRNQEKKFAWVYKWITEEGTTKVVCDGVSTLSCYLSLGIIAWVHLTFG